MSVSPWALRNLIDQNLKFTQPGKEVYLRVQNADVDADDAAASLGFQWAPTGSQTKGYTDIVISPPPSVRPVSLHDVGLNSERLQMGAYHFYISHTFVKCRMEEQEYTDPYQVWRDDKVIGIRYNSRLFEIAEPLPEDQAGETIIWDVVCNMVQRPSQAPSP